MRVYIVFVFSFDFLLLCDNSFIGRRVVVNIQMSWHWLKCLVSHTHTHTHTYTGMCEHVLIDMCVYDITD